MEVAAGKPPNLLPVEKRDGHAFHNHLPDGRVNGNTQYSYPDNDALPGTCLRDQGHRSRNGQQQFQPNRQTDGEKPPAGLQVYIQNPGYWGALPDTI